MKEFDQEEFNNFVLDNNVIGFFEKPITLVFGGTSNWYFNWRDVSSDVFLLSKVADFVISFTKDLELQPNCFFGVPEGATKLGILTQVKWAHQNSCEKDNKILSMGRAKPKDHGDPKDKFFVGTPKGKAIILEDVTTTGDSLIRTIDQLKEAGINVIAAFGLTNRMELRRNDGKSVKDAVESRGVPYYSLSNALELLPAAARRLKPAEHIARALEEESKKYSLEPISFIFNNENAIDRLLKKIDERQSSCIIGLDPQVKFLPPQILKNSLEKYGNNFRAVAEAYIEFNKAIIDATYDLVPAYKLNMCFYEKYGSEGVRAFQQTASYVKEKGCVLMEDAKRNEVSESAKAYAEGHLGEVDLCGGSKTKSLDVDFLVINPYLGSDGIIPFTEVCGKCGKGVFILDKTSNPSSGEFQDKLIEINDEEKEQLEELGLNLSENKIKLYTLVALYINKYAQQHKGERGYSLIGAVVGATYPEQAHLLRKLMPNSFFLVPGYGAQGGGGEDVVPCFNEDGYGAVVNSSRGIIYAYQNKGDPERFAESAREAIIKMIKDIFLALKQHGKLPKSWGVID